MPHSRFVRRRSTIILEFEVMHIIKTFTSMVCTALLSGVMVSQAAPTLDAAEMSGDPYGILQKTIPAKLAVLTIEDGHDRQNDDFQGLGTMSHKK